MGMFKISIPLKAYLVVEVEADNEGEAMDKAIDEASVSLGKSFGKDAIIAADNQQLILFDLNADDAEIFGSLP